MEEIGIQLRMVRQRWGLTLREVEERCNRLAQQWGVPSYRISASWLDRVEREGRRLSAVKLLVLAGVYGIPPEHLLAYCSPGMTDLPAIEPPSSPNTTLLLSSGPLEEHARLWLPDTITAGPIPEDTKLIRSEKHLPVHYRRGIIGRRDKTLDPMLKAGSIVLIDTQRRAIAHRREWTTEFDRPIYFLVTHTDYVCGWCELDQNAEWLSLVPHSLSYVTARRWKYRKEVEVIGRIAVALMRLDNTSSGR